MTCIIIVPIIRGFACIGNGRTEEYGRNGEDNRRPQSERSFKRFKTKKTSLLLCKAGSDTAGSEAATIPAVCLLFDV